MLLLGVAVGSLVIVPLLSLLYNAYGFVGAYRVRGWIRARPWPCRRRPS